MAKSFEGRYEKARNRIKNRPEISDDDKRLIFEFLDANDPRKNTYSMPDGKDKSMGTLSNYANCLNQLARDLGGYADATDYDLNSLMDDYAVGNAESVKDEGLTRNTVRTYQSTLRRFYYYHDDIGIERDNINFTKTEPTKVDERDMFSPDDVEALRNEAKSSGARDAALVDVLLYTGQRVSAVINLRIKDIDVEAGAFYLNEEEGDLKGASGKRPLLGATKAAREWINAHPTGNPEDYFITHKIAADKRTDMTIGDKLSPDTVRGTLRRIGKAAGVDKPVNPHNFRHHFVTVCKRDYGMDNDTIKHLIGHDADSKVMERTYAHLTDEDYIQAAEEKAGLREPTDDSPLTPPVCSCGEPLESTWKSCPSCGAVYAPDSQAANDDIQDAMYESKGDAETDDENEGVDAVRELYQENPEIKQALVSELKEELLGDLRDDDEPASAVPEQ